MFRSMNPVEWIREAWAGVGSFFSGLKNRFTGWGQDIIQGLIDGIKKQAKKAVESVTNIGENIAGKFKSVLGINSPSRIFMEYGINITEGLTGGIEKTENRAGHASEGLALTTTRAIQQTIQPAPGGNSNIAEYTGGNFTLSYSPTVNITGSAPDQVKQDFTRELRNHADEIAGIVERYFQNKQRLSFE